MPFNTDAYAQGQFPEADPHWDPMLVRQNRETKTCNPLNLTILKPDFPIWITGYPMALQISSQGVDPGVYLYIVRKT